VADHTTGSGGGTVAPPVAVREDVRVAERVSVMIVDDQPPFRDAAKAVLSRIDGFDLVAEVASGEDAVATSGELQPDLVLMDINMGALDGIEATRLITGAQPTTKVILVSTYSLEDLPVTARTSGAIAYVNKDELSPRVVRRLWESGGDPAWRSAQPSI
jgi:two-component system, NarL family, invasion response regulator UvrY